MTNLKIEYKIIQTKVQRKMWKISLEINCIEPITFVKNRIREDGISMREIKTNSSKTIKIFGANYSLNITYKRIKNPKLDIKEKQIEISLPSKYKKINNDAIVEMLLEKMYEAIANKELDIIMEKVRTTLKFAPEDYKIQKLEKRLCKCVANKLVINSEIVKYREDIIEYVLFYEFCRLKINKSGKKIRDILKVYMPNYENYEYELVGIQY